MPGATVSTPGPGNGQPVNKYSSTRVFVVIGGTIAVGLGLGTLSTGCSARGYNRRAAVAFHVTQEDREPSSSLRGIGGGPLAHSVLLGHVIS